MSAQKEALTFSTVLTAAMLKLGISEIQIDRELIEQARSKTIELGDTALRGLRVRLLRSTETNQTKET